MKNYLNHSLWFVLTVLLALFVLHWLPRISLFGHPLRQVDLLSDVRPMDSEDTEIDSLLLPPKIKPAFVDTCRNGLTCIEDYSDSTMRGVVPFYKALDKITADKRLVRIAFFGDSFIEGDIFTADLREMLQRRFGGCGVGFVPITSNVAGFRVTVRHRFSGWQSHAVTDSAYFNKSLQGISGQYFIPSQNAYVELQGVTNKFSFLDTCRRASVFLINRGNEDVRISATINRESTYDARIASSDSLRQVIAKGKIGSIRWTIHEGNPQCCILGTTIDGVSGIALDNFLLRGSSGLSLRYIPSETLDEFNRQRPYDLIVLQYGLNVATKFEKNYDGYKKGLLASIEHLKTCFPDAGILLLGVSDRNYKSDNGELRTMPGVKNLLRYQQHIAAESNIAFWNTFEAMGGEGSMATLVQKKPSMANYDYTHINALGGKYLATLLFDALMYGKEQYDKKCAHEKE